MGERVEEYLSEKGYFKVGDPVYFPSKGTYWYNTIRYEQYEPKLRGRTGTVTSIEVHTITYRDGNVKTKVFLDVLWDIPGEEMFDDPNWVHGAETTVDLECVGLATVSPTELEETYKRLGVRREDQPG